MNSSGTQASVANEYLKLAAEAVRDRSATEGALRTAIGRAYYAVFLTARDQLFGPDMAELNNKRRKRLASRFQIKSKRNSPGSHEIVIFAITNVPRTRDVNPITLSHQVEQLKAARVNADYVYDHAKINDIPAPTWQKYANDTVALASQLLPIVRRLPSYPD